MKSAQKAELIASLVVVGLVCQLSTDGVARFMAQTKVLEQSSYEEPGSQELISWNSVEVIQEFT